MHVRREIHLLPAAFRRRLVRAARGLVHALALTAGLISSGLVPAHLLSSSNEAEAQQRDSSTEYAELHCDARIRPRRIALQRGDAPMLGDIPAVDFDRRDRESVVSLVDLLSFDSSLVVGTFDPLALLTAPPAA